ncbi:MAG TPA: aminoglycoside phosphotransferase family protein [Thermoanaerobaculia bacterium]|nr:aminoglycoside phosphotransferase family protein [Thermoanaerobaculia bacterium]
MPEAILEGGTRIEWADVPSVVRRSIEERFRSQVVQARTQKGGFSPGLAARVLLKDGRRAFVKAVGPEPNADSPALHRREAVIAAALPATLPVPRFLWSCEASDWVALAFEDIEGSSPGSPWRPHDLARVLDMLTNFTRILSPAPFAAEPIATRFSEWFSGWRKLARRSTAQQLDSWSRCHLAELVDLEVEWELATQGTTLLHADLRADNILLTPTDVFVVDWPWACVGAAWFDLLVLLVNVAAQGQAVPGPTFEKHPVGALAEPAAVNASLSALAGFFTERSLAPPEPGLPRLREFQRAHGAAAREWLAHRMGWEL